MKIAFVSTIRHYPWGGADTLWTHAAEAAVERGDSVLLVTSELVRPHPRIAALREHGARLLIRRTPGRGSGVRFPFLPRSADEKTIIAALDRFAPDLVVVSCGGTYDLLIEPRIVGWQRATATPLRIVANYQLENPSLPEPDRQRIAEIFSRLDRIFFVSTRNLNSTRRHLLRPLSNAVVVHNPLRCGPGDRLNWPEHSGAYRFATVGRLDQGKGVVLLLHALATALRSETNWQLDIFGHGPDEPLIRATISALGLERRVFLAGYVSSLTEIWADRQVLFSPSLEDGVPMTIPEAALLGRVVAATQVGGAEDWIEQGRTGYLCPAPTLPLIVDLIRAAWAERSHWSTIAAEAATQTAQHYRPSDFQQLIQPL